VICIIVPPIVRRGIALTAPWQEQIKKPPRRAAFKNTDLIGI
jgi:hypothetical protein